MQGLKYLKHRKKQLNIELKQVNADIKKIKKRKQKRCKHQFKINPKASWSDGELISGTARVCEKCGLEE